MDFELDKIQTAFKNSVRQFAKKVVLPGVQERDEKGEFSFEIWKRMNELNLPGLCIAEEYGGEETDAMTTLIAMQAFAAATRDMTIMCAWATHLLLAAMPIQELGTKEQKKKYLPKMAKGEWIGALALTEASAGSDAASMQTRAEKKGNNYILNGSKTFISNAPIADVFIVFASTDLSKRQNGISMFIVDRNMHGLKTGNPLKKFNGHTPTGEVFFDNCEVPVENLLGEENKGFTLMLTSLGWERLSFGALIGYMEADLEDCIAYVKERKQFGKKIGSFQLVQALLAEMKMDLEAARHLTLKLAWLMDHNKPAALDAALAKTFVSEAYERNSRKAIQVFGGNGCMREYQVGKGLWEAKVSTIGGGTSQIQRTIIGRMLTGLPSR